MKTSTDLESSLRRSGNGRFVLCHLRLRSGIPTPDPDTAGRHGTPVERTRLVDIPQILPVVPLECRRMHDRAWPRAPALLERHARRVLERQLYRSGWVMVMVSLSFRCNYGVHLRKTPWKCPVLSCGGSGAAHRIRSAAPSSDGVLDLGGGQGRSVLVDIIQLVERLAG